MSMFRLFVSMFRLFCFYISTFSLLYQDFSRFACHPVEFPHVSKRKCGNIELLKHRNFDTKKEKFRNEKVETSKRKSQHLGPSFSCSRYAAVQISLMYQNMLLKSLLLGEYQELKYLVKGSNINSFDEIRQFV